MDHLDKEVIESLSEPAKRVFKVWIIVPNSEC